jgi:hypothetical protein
MCPRAVGARSVIIKNVTRLDPPMLPSDDELRSILTSARTIAVVGISEKPERDSNGVSRYLKAQGYRIVPVNPSLSTVLSETSYPSLAAIPPEVRVDIADLFRQSERVPPIVDQAIARGVPVIWMQVGVEHPEAAAKARRHGITVLENTCIMVQHRRLRIPPVGGR